MSLGSAVKKSTTLLLVSSISHTVSEVRPNCSAGATITPSAVVSNTTSGVPSADDIKSTLSRMASTLNPFSTSRLKEARSMAMPDVEPVVEQRQRDRVLFEADLRLTEVAFHTPPRQAVHREIQAERFAFHRLVVGAVDHRYGEFAVDLVERVPVVVREQGPPFEVL